MRTPRRPDLLALLLAAAAAPAALAQPPAAIPDHNALELRARVTFTQFARAFMDRLHELGDQERQRPSVQPGVGEPLVSYRGAGDDYEIELSPTGNPVAPWVGVLRYTQQTYRCDDASGARCELASTLPLTEIFRFRDGRWTY